MAGMIKRTPLLSTQTTSSRTASIQSNVPSARSARKASNAAILQVLRYSTSSICWFACRATDWNYAPKISRRRIAKAVQMVSNSLEVERRELNPWAPSKSYLWSKSSKSYRSTDSAWRCLPQLRGMTKCRPICDIWGISWRKGAWLALTSRWLTFANSLKERHWKRMKRDPCISHKRVV